MATRDIAGTAARALLDESWTGQRSIPVVGPDDLSPRQMAEIVSDIAGRPVRAEHVPAEEYKTTMTGYGLSPGFVQGLINMAAAQDDGIYDNDAAEASRAAPASNSGAATRLAPGSCRSTARPGSCDSDQGAESADKFIAGDRRIH